VQFIYEQQAEDTFLFQTRNNKWFSAYSQYPVGFQTKDLAK